MRIRRLLGTALTVPILIGGLLLVTAGPAGACTLVVPASEATNAARADAVFVGTLASQVNQWDWAAKAARDELVREVQRRPYRRQRVDQLLRKVTHSTDRAVLTFKVRRVYKARLADARRSLPPWSLPAHHPWLRDLVRS